MQQREVVKLLFPSSPYLQSLLYLSSISVLSPDSIYVLYLLHLILSARHRNAIQKRERKNKIDKGSMGLRERGATMENKWCDRVRKREL